MAMMLGALYRALIAAHVDEEDARKAAEEVAAYDARLANLDANMKLVQWMLGFLIALVIGNLWLTVSILGRLPK